MIILGSYYPHGSTRITEEVVKQIEHAAQLDLGPTYFVSATDTKLPGTNLEGNELTVTRNAVDPRGRRGTSADRAAGVAQALSWRSKKLLCEREDVLDFRIRESGSGL
jgi:hypothetical protein